MHLPQAQVFWQQPLGICHSLLDSLPEQQRQPAVLTRDMRAVRCLPATLKPKGGWRLGGSGEWGGMREGTASLVL